MPGETDRPPRGGARTCFLSASLGAGAAVLYACTLCPTVSWYDSAEFSATAASLRVVPHPPGYPLYALLGHAFTWLPGEPAWGLNVMSAVFGALAVVLLHRVALRLPLHPVAAAIVPLLLAVAPSVWSNAVVAEVYTPGLSFLLGAMLLCLHARERHDPRWAWAGAGLAGLGLGVHMSIATWGLGFAALVAQAVWRPGTRPPWQAWARWGLGCVVAAALGSLIFLLIPLGPFEAVTPLGPVPDTPARIWRRFFADLRGGVFRGYFRPMPALERLIQIGRIALHNMGWPAAVLACIGVLWSAARARRIALVLALGLVGNVAFFFRYHVPDLDVFLLPGLVSGLLWTGYGVQAALHLRRSLGLLIAAVAVVSIGGRAARSYASVDLSQHRAARAYGTQACAVLPPGAIVAMTARPDEWRLSSVLLYMHEAGEGCGGVEFWGAANAPMIRAALEGGREVYAYVDDPRFARGFTFAPHGPLFRMRADDGDR